jgi:hypothetical protein
VAGDEPENTNVGAQADSGFVRVPPAMIAIPLAPIVLDRRYRLVLKALWRLRRSRGGRWTIGVGYTGAAIALAVLAARHLATGSWPLSNGHPGLLAAAAVLLLLAHALKAFGWARLFPASERPKPLALAAGNGGASLIGVILPGRFDDAMRIVGVRVLALSLVMLGLIDSAALAPLALAAAVLPGVGIGVRTGLAVVGVAGVAAAAVVLALPDLASSRRALRHRLGRWLSERTTSRRAAFEAWLLVSACWLVRALALFLLLGTLGIGYSLPVALLFLCAGAAAAALPVGPAGAATQAGAHGAALIATGVGASQALAVAVSVTALGVLCGTLILLTAITWQIGLALRPKHIAVGGAQRAA